MRLTDILKPQLVKVPLDATDKQSAINELCQIIANHTDLDDPQSSAKALQDAVWEREQTRTTGIGHGIAIPHGKTDCIQSLTLALGKPAQPIEFQAVDKKPVDLIILLASPTSQTGPHIQALATISKMLTDENIRDQIKQATDSQQVYSIIQDYQAAQVG